MTPLGIKPTTYQLVAQCLNKLCHHIPPTLALHHENNSIFPIVSAREIQQYSATPAPASNICDNKNVKLTV
jgi:hypothetical protein